MAKPAGLITKNKDNSRKKYREHDAWMKGKRLGRPKQQWVDDTPQNLIGESEGHWEKVQ
jgi:hypothetical protein